MNTAFSNTVFDIQRCSLYDGPGIRTTVFLKGCPLSCKWCHNPESQSIHPQLSYYSNRCTLCGECSVICPDVHQIKAHIHTIHYSKCTACGKCSRHCPSNALKVIGWNTSAEEVMAVVRKDIRYYQQTGGGLTVTGGEPFSQFDFLKKLVSAAKAEKIHTCVETCGCTTKQHFADILPDVDLFLFDYKVTSSPLHKQYTGTDNKLILDNFKFLYDSNKKIILRCPVIPSYNDTEEHFQGIAEIEKNYPHLAGIEIMPYHNLGKDKAAAIGKTYEVTSPTVDESTKALWKMQLAHFGCSTSITNSF